MISNLQQGEAGESQSCGFLQALGFSAAKIRPDLCGTDFVAMNWTKDIGIADVLFLFQIKTHSNGLDAGARKIKARFLALACHLPAFVLVGTGDPHRPKWWICSVFNWMKDNPACLSESQNEVTIERKYFRSIRSITDMTLSEMLRDEAHRTTPGSPSIWTPKFPPLSAMSVEDVFVCLDRLPHVEPTQAMIKWIKEQTPHPNDLFVAAKIREFRCAIFRQPADIHMNSAQDIVPPGWRLVPTINDRDKSAKIVRSFFRSVESLRTGGHHSVPRYHWLEIAIWRILFDIWPGAFGMVDQVLSDPSRWSLRPSKRTWSLSQVKAAIGLAGSVAHSRDEASRDRARALLMHLKDQVRVSNAADSRDRYEFQHQLLFSLASTDPVYNAPCADFIVREGVRDNRELILNRRYYRCRDDSALLASLRSRIQAPRVRDAGMIPVLGAQLDLAMRNGYVHL